VLPLSTRRLVLRRFRPGDAVALAAYRSDPDVARYQGWSAPVGLADARALAAEFAAGDPLRPGWFQYAVERTADRRLIGDLGVRRDGDPRRAEIGFTVSSAHQRHGYATEALTRLLEHLFAHGLHKAYAECDARNTASAALLRRLGFQQEGHLRAHTWIKGEWTDDLLFGLLGTDR